LESPEIYFIDFVDISHKGKGTRFDVSSLLLEVCEPGSVKAVAAVSSTPYAYGIKKLDDGIFEVNTLEDCEMELTIMVRGTRLGFGGRRFARRTQAEYLKNTQFWREASGG
jgi:hypothetical protein